MKKFLYYLIVLVCTASWYSCNEEGNIYYLDSYTPAPEQVSDLQVVNTPGGAIITYKIPKDNKLSYVKAVYEIQPGVFREAKSSFYKDTLALVGFGDTLSHQVEIYSVGRNEKASTPLSVKVKPLIPPVESVFETLTLEATFGGINIKFNNESRADLAIFVMMMDTIGQHSWIPLTTYYNAVQNGDFSFRGLKPEERDFAVCIRDRWNNRSDTLIKTLIPLYEELVPKNKWKALHLTGDFWKSPSTSTSLEKAWNDDLTDVFETIDQVTLPQWFTIDLNQTVIFNRMKLFQRVSYPYSSVWVKAFEIWGTNNYDSDGGWNNWELLGKFDSRTPSGSVWPNYTADDMEYQKAGEDFTFPQPIPAVRYIRVKVLDTYGGTGQIKIGELTFWGQIK
jgi:hypothetical protein